MAKYLKLDKDNYLGIIKFTDNKKMIEIEADNEKTAYKKAKEYAIAYCKNTENVYVSINIIKIPDCISVLD